MSSSDNKGAAEEQGEAQVESAGISSAAAIESANIQAAGALQAAGIQAQATNRGLDIQEEQYNATVERLDPYLQLGLGSIDDVAQSSSISGFNDRLGQILDGSQFDSLKESRYDAANAQLASLGATRSGRAAEAVANIDSDLALQIENQLYGRSLTNVQSGQNAAANLGGFGANYANASSSLLSNGAAVQGQYISNAAAASAGGITAAANYQADSVTNIANANAAAASADAQQTTQNISAGIGALSLLLAFSDERLKENMEIIGRIHDLDVYEWDWKEGAKGIAGTEMSHGFKAQDVAEKHPDCVRTHEATGLLMVNYTKLNKKLEALNNG